MHVNEQQTTHNEQQESCVHVAVVAGEVKWSVASNVLRVDLSAVLKKNHHNLRNRERTSSTTSMTNEFGFSLVAGGIIFQNIVASTSGKATNTWAIFFSKIIRFYNSGWICSFLHLCGYTGRPGAKVSAGFQRS